MPNKNEVKEANTIKEKIKEEEIAVLEVKEITKDTVKVEMPDGEIVELDKDSLVDAENEPIEGKTDMIDKSIVVGLISKASARISRINSVSIAVREVRAMLNGIKEDVEKL